MTVRQIFQEELLTAIDEGRGFDAVDCAVAWTTERVVAMCNREASRRHWMRQDLINKFFYD